MKPNILYVHSHDTGRRVSPYGYSVDTPNYQRLAESGALFRQAFCAAPTCSPSRAALLTGQSAHETGLLGLEHRGFKLKDPTRLLPYVLRQNGYATSLCGITHVADPDRDIKPFGYDEHVKTPTNNALYVGPAAAAHVEKLAADGKPFFFDVGFVETHRSRFPPRDPRDDPRFAQVPRSMPDTAATREDAAIFASAARILDTGLGQVLDALDRTGLASNTIVVCTTDHGISFPRHKCDCFDGGMEVLLILRGPADLVPAGVALDAMVSHVDLFPTLCALAGIEAPAWLEGKSLVPVLRGEAAEVNDEVFGEITFHAVYEPTRAIRTRRHKLIRRFDVGRSKSMANLDDGLSKAAYVAAGFAGEVPPAEALYDLTLDPGERNNLVGDPAHAATLTDLRGRLERWMRRTDDPLLSGPITLPPGARVNQHADPSPQTPIPPR